MAEKTRIVDPTRRAVLKTACVGTIACATTTLSSLASAVAADEEMELVRRLTGGTPTESDRVRLEMPPVFANGYTVPLALEVDTPMTDADHVRVVRVFAPRNPLSRSPAFTSRRGAAAPGSPPAFGWRNRRTSWRWRR